MDCDRPWAGCGRRVGLTVQTPTATMTTAAAEGTGRPSEEAHRRYAASLSPEEILLLTLRDELYDGGWDRMLEDLRNRLHGKPYVFKLVHRIEEDLRRIERLRTYEAEHQVDLARYAPSGA